MPDAPPILLPGRLDPRFVRVFVWWVRRMFRKDFFAVRLARDNSSLLSDLAAHPAPLIGVSNHSSWWDPLVFLLLHTRFTPGRGSTGPVDAAQWQRYGFMKKLGLFGIDPHDPHSADVMVEHVLRQFRERPRTNFWITPQGQFVDPRQTIRIRPGVSMVAAAASAARIDLRGISIAIEYVMWVDRRPELLLRFEPIVPPTMATIVPPTPLVPPTCAALEASRCDQPAAQTPPPTSTATSTTAWHRAITRAMRTNQEALASLSIARDPSAFTTLLGDHTSINPLYDLWQRVRGRSGAIEARRFEE